MAQQNGLSLTKADLATVTAIWHVTQGDKPGIGWQADYFRSLSLQKGLSFVLHSIDTYSDYGLALTIYNASNKTIICRFTEYLIHQISTEFHIALPLTKEHILQSKRVKK